MLKTALAQEIETYRQNHQRSLQLWERAKRLFPAGVSHNIRDFSMSSFGLGPPFIASASGCKLVDVDSNSYTDYWLTHGAAILGHSHKAIKEAINQQLLSGNHFGMVNEQALILAEKIIGATPSIEELRFCTTGTEATMYTSRLARAFTQKRKIAKVRGGWHGGNDTLFYFVKQMQKGIETKGLKNQEEANILSFDYNDTEGALKLLREHKDDLAAVIMEPVLGAGGAIPPKEGFLESIREETERLGILLIYDEIITGFRLAYSSGQGFFGVTPDLTTMGKILGGGMPIGVIGGRTDILEQANLQKNGGVWIGGGTFSGNPTSMVAGIATLKTLASDHATRYQKLNALGEEIRTKISTLLREHKLPAVVTGVGSMVSIHWFKKHQQKIESSSEIQVNYDKETSAIFQLLMFNRDILVRGGLGYLSFQHTQKDISQTLAAITSSLNLMKSG